MNYAAPDGKECCKIPTVHPASFSQQLLDTGPGRPKALLALFSLVKLLMVSITYDFKYFSILPNCLILYFF